jgi:hypothetical protein
MIFEMITGDIATFGVIYVIVVTAFGQGIKLIIIQYFVTEVSFIIVKYHKELSFYQHMLHIKRMKVKLY